MVQRLEWFQDRQRRLPLTPKATPRKSSCSFGMCQFGSALLESRPSCAFISACLPVCAARWVSIGNVGACHSRMDVGCLRSKRLYPGTRRCRKVPRPLSDLHVSDDARCHWRIAPRWTNSQCRSLPPKRTESASSVGNKCSVRLFCGSARPTAARLADTAFTITRLALASPPR